MEVLHMKLSEIVNIDELRGICESFTALSGATTAILDLEGNILITTGWQDICMRFHRVHPETAQRCLESDTILAGQLRQGEQYTMYKCKNGLVDVAFPIIIKGEHFANFFTGQFFFNPPDKEHFISQAEEFGFDKDAYIEALNRVPIFPEDQVRAFMEFFTRLTQMVAKMGLAQKRLNETFSQLQESQERLNFHVDNSPMATIEWNSDFILTRWAGESEKIFGWTKAETVGKMLMDLNMIYEEDMPIVQSTVKQLATGSSSYIVLSNRFYTKDRKLITCESYNSVLTNAQGQIVSVLSQVLDISDRKQAEDALLEKTLLLEQEILDRKSAQEELALKHRQLEDLNRSLEQRIDTSVAELRLKDQLMIKQSRQAEMGEMINNIAHQWKQPLNNLALTIQDMAYDYDAGLPNPEEIEAKINQCLDLIMFMSQTIEDFRSFFREDRQMTVYGIRQSISSAISLISASMKDNNIEIVVEPGDEVQVAGYPNEYSQVLLNLMGNAREVFIERSVAAPAIAVRVFGEEGRAVVTVSDNGGGISKEVIEKIFNPYFTTKELDKGTGIGLFMSKNIIEQHMGGSLTVENIKGGAQFRIDIPMGTLIV